MIELEKCPHCGGKAKLKRGFPGMQNAKNRYALVQCTVCFCRTPTFHQAAYDPAGKCDEYAIECWNRRAG